jgi:hypothetical protein
MGYFQSAPGAKGAATSDPAAIMGSRQVVPSHLGVFFFFVKIDQFLQVRTCRENSNSGVFGYPCLSPLGAAKGATMAEPA